MKPYSNLTRADLAQYPVWEWLPEDAAVTPAASCDESFVRPTALAELPTGAFAQFIVALSVELKSGGPMPGIAEVTTGEGGVSIEPTTVFLLDRQLPIPGLETNRLLTRYTKSRDNCPVGWTLAVPLAGESARRSGEIRHGDMKDIVAMGVEALLALKALRKK